MTTTDTTGVQLLRAIRDNPGDDTPRVVFADYLDELGDHDRAAFIRVQCRIARIQADCMCGSCRKSGQHHNGPCAVDKERDELPDGRSTNAFLRLRCNELLAANPRWSRLSCPECGTDPRAGCQTCDGTGELLAQASRLPAEPCPVEFHRGFIRSVTLPTLADILQPERICRTCRTTGRVWRTGEEGEGRRCPVCRGGCGGDLMPTGWARALVKAVPTLTRLVPGDVTPRREPDDRLYEWWEPRNGVYHGDDGDVPSLVFDLMYHTQVADFKRRDEYGRWMRWFDRDAALDALSETLCRVVRGDGV